ncbi:MAG: RidA family protein [Pseudomonadota bacterium]
MTDIVRTETGTRMSQAVAHNGTIYLAGQVAAEGESVTAQTTGIIEKIERLLAENNSAPDRMLQAVIWLADMSDFAEMNAVWDAWVPQGHAPARACGEAKLATPGFKVEIIVIAAAA